MKCCLECLPCFLKQALEHARLLTSDELTQKKIVSEAAMLIPQLSLEMCPAEMIRELLLLLSERLKGLDLYKDIKSQSNVRAMKLFPILKEKVVQSQDRLLTAVEIAIMGNIIDYAAKNMLDIEGEIDKLLDQDFSAMSQKGIFQYEEFKKDLEAAKTVLYIGDNAGEIVFDKVLMEEFSKEKQIIFAVRGKPVLNDALIEDALFCGIDEVARVMSSGVDAPGTILKYCSKEFCEIFEKADMVISKGQGNYEALSDVDRSIYFLLKIKCPVIAEHAGSQLGDIVLQKKSLVCI